jgi:phosphoribosylformylglycinamidine synthase
MHATASGPRVAVVVFPGSNCEHDVAAALARCGAEPELYWHDSERLDGVAGVILPGGFAHGDYLRPGAIARFSPVMGDVARLAAAGAPVLGICNGFQVLTEAGLLPGALAKNAGLRFRCETVACRVESTASVLTAGLRPGSVLRLPINHYEGRFTCDEATLRAIERSGRVALRYLGDPNGSLAGIAALSNDAGNVVGCMPHPERAMDLLLGSADGVPLVSAFAAAATAFSSVQRHDLHGSGSPGREEAGSTAMAAPTAGATT